MTRTLTAIGLALLTLGGCATQTSGNRPAWVDKGANLDHPEFLYVIGRCRGKPTADEARRCAIEDAREQLRAVVPGAQGGLVQDEWGTSQMGMQDRGGGQHVLANLNDYWILLAYPKKQLVPTPPPAAR